MIVFLKKIRDLRCEYSRYYDIETNRTFKFCVRIPSPTNNSLSCLQPYIWKRIHLPLNVGSNTKSELLPPEKKSVLIITTLSLVVSRPSNPIVKDSKQLSQ